MKPIDPKISPEALSIVSCSVLIALFDQLIASNVLTQSDIHNAIRTAMLSVGARAQHSVEGSEAAKMLQSLLTDFPQR
jgi:hypothetical protein